MSGHWLTHRLLRPAVETQHGKDVAKAAASLKGEVHGKCCEEWPECSHMFEAVTGEPWVDDKDGKGQRA